MPRLVDTSTSYPDCLGAGGFAALRGFNGAQHPFTLSLVASEGDGRLPRASTCFNTLFLPCYSSPDVLRERLLAALSGQQAFDEGAAQRYTLQFSLVCLAEQSATPRLVVHRLQTRVHARSRKQHCQPSTA